MGRSDRLATPSGSPRIQAMSGRSRSILILVALLDLAAAPARASFLDTLSNLWTAGTTKAGELWQAGKKTVGGWFGGGSGSTDLGPLLDQLEQGQREVATRSADTRELLAGFGPQGPGAATRPFVEERLRTLARSEEALGTLYTRLAEALKDPAAVERLDGTSRQRIGDIQRKQQALVAEYEQIEGRIRTWPPAPAASPGPDPLATAAIPKPGQPIPRTIVDTSAMLGDVGPAPGASPPQAAVPRAPAGAVPAAAAPPPATPAPTGPAKVFRDSADLLGSHASPENMTQAARAEERIRAEGAGTASGYGTEGRPGEASTAGTPGTQPGNDAIPEGSGEPGEPSPVAAGTAEDQTQGGAGAGTLALPSLEAAPAGPPDPADPRVAALIDEWLAGAGLDPYGRYLVPGRIEARGPPETDGLTRAAYVWNLLRNQPGAASVSLQEFVEKRLKGQAVSVAPASRPDETATAPAPRPATGSDPVARRKALGAAQTTLSGSDRGAGRSAYEAYSGSTGP